MKILFDARLYGLENAGIGRYVMNLVNELARIDHKNEYILLLRKKYFNELNYPSNFTKVLADFRHYSLLEQIKLPLIISKYQPDVTHFPHFNVPVSFRGNYVVTIHDVLMHKRWGDGDTTLPAPLYFLKRLGYWRVFTAAVKQSKFIIVPSENIKKEIGDLYPGEQKKLAVIYEGIPAVKTKNDENSKDILNEYKLDKPYFIYTGNIYPHKNIERAIRAIKLLNQHSLIYFAIVSSRGIFTERLERLVAKYDAKRYIKLLGFVPDEKLWVLYKNSLGFVYPSLSEGFGLPGLEAISAGTIALISKIPVFEEVYKNYALFFDPMSVESIFYSLQDAVKMKKSERIEMIKSGQNFIKKYSWENMAKETLAVYNAACRE